MVGRREDGGAKKPQVPFFRERRAVGLVHMLV